MAKTVTQADSGEGVVTGTVVNPDLVFTTPAKQRPADPDADRLIPVMIDGEEYTVVRPRKLRETLAGLVEAGARRATEADALYAGSNFLRKVFTPESAQRLQARLDDDEDDLELEDLFGYIEKISVMLIRSAPGGGQAGAPEPARRRARR